MSSKNNETRNRILKATWTLLEDQNSADVRMVDIAKSAGISRQAVYLHFENRADLLIATTRYIDAEKDIDKRLLASRKASNGTDRLKHYIDAWGNYIPEIYGVTKALLDVYETDKDVAKAWDDRMLAMRDGCEAAVKALIHDDKLKGHLTLDDATNMLWMLLNVHNWKFLTQQCGWSQKKYIELITYQAQHTLVQQ